MTPLPNLRPGIGRIVILYACLGAVLGQAGLFIDLPSLPGLATEFQVGDAAAQSTISVYALGYGLSQLVWGPLSDRHGRRPVSLAGLGLFTVASLLLAAAPGFGVFQALRLLQGVGAGSCTSVSRAALRDVFEGRAMARAMSTVSLCFAGALGFAPFAGGLIASAAGWRADFLALAALALLTLAGVRRWLAETLPALTEAETPGTAQAPAAMNDATGLDARALGAAYLRLLGDGRFLLPAAIAMVASGMIAFYDAVSPFAFEQTLGIGRAAFGGLSLSLTGAYLVGALVVIRWVVTVGQARLLRSGLLCVVVGSLLMLALGLAGRFSVATLLPPMLLIVAGCGQMIPIGLAMPMQAFPRQAGQASALTGFLQQEGSGLLVALATGIPATSQVPLAAALLALAAVLGLLERAYRRVLRRKDA